MGFLDAQGCTGPHGLPDHQRSQPRAASPISEETTSHLPAKHATYFSQRSSTFFLFYSRVTMASEMVLSPRQVLASPTRRPLQNLHTNMNITPRRLASGKTSSMSPLKSNTPLTPALLLSTRKNENKLTESIMLNPSKKRPIGDVIAVERDHTRASFSSLINFDPSSDNAEPASSATTSDDTMYKSVSFFVVVLCNHRV
jgi:hypothetical protein